MTAGAFPKPKIHGRASTATANRKAAANFTTTAAGSKSLPARSTGASEAAI
jgi:hypothetical protein